VRSTSLVLVAQDGLSTRIVHNFLRERFPITGIVIEQPVPMRDFLASRARRLGVLTVAGQVLFRLTAVPCLTRHARERRAEIMASCALDDSPLPEDRATRVESINSDHAREVLCSLAPDVIVISGTRIIEGKILRSVDAPFLNLHAGITPKYRGVHGGYWALAQGEPEACGVTVHLVDEGVDTGPVLGQAAIATTGADSIVTYPLLQLSVGLPLLADAIERVVRGEAADLGSPDGESQQWSHPTLRQYLAIRRRTGVS
jgi:methionyl-tRNA formyltransferase